MEGINPMTILVLEALQARDALAPPKPKRRGK